MRGILESRALFWALLALPFTVMAWDFVQGRGRLGPLILDSGEWSVRLLVIALAMTPIRMIFRGHHWPMWFIARRSDVGMAAFLYAVLHVLAYSVREGYLANILADLAITPILIGWGAFLAMAVPFFTSGRAMTRRLGTVWKPLQRFAYAAAILAFFHWTMIRVNDIPAYIHFLPLAALELYRLVRSLMRPWRHLSE